MHSESKWNNRSPHGHQRPSQLQQATPTSGVSTSAAVDRGTWCVCRVHTDRRRNGGGLGGFLRSRFPPTGDVYEHDDGQMTSSNCLFGSLTHRQSTFIVCLLSTVSFSSSHSVEKPWSVLLRTVVHRGARGQHAEIQPLIVGGRLFNIVTSVYFVTLLLALRLC